MINIKRKPTSPGEILSEEYLMPLEITQSHLARHIGCDVKVINRIVNGRAAVTPAIAIKLAAALGTTPQFWMNAQQAVDVYKAKKQIKVLPKLLLAAS